jgi:hypothetical protein
VLGKPYEVLLFGEISLAEYYLLNMELGRE